MEVPIPPKSIDAICMKDYIEHTCHPFQDLKKPFRLLRNRGAIYIETFHIDCDAFMYQRGEWFMLAWNHVYHFSPSTLKAMVCKAGFEIVNCEYNNKDILIKIEAIRTNK